MSDIVFEPMISIFAIAALAAGALTLSVYAYVRGADGVAPGWRAMLALLRGVGIVAIAVLLMKPMRPKPGEAVDRKPVFALLFDTSRSMNTEDVAGSSRLVVEQDLLCGLERRSPELWREYEVELYEFSDKASRIAPAELHEREMADGGKTLLAEGVQSVLDRTARAGVRSAGMVVFSDGRHNGVEDVGRVACSAKSLGVPIWTCCIGTQAQARDVAVVSRGRSDFVFVDQKSAIKASILQQGCHDDAVKVQLLREGRPAGEPHWVSFEGRARREVSFPIVERKKGLVKYEVAAEPLDGETNVTNNRRTLFVNVIAEKMKVLFLEGEPYWDSKFLVQALRRDPNVQLTSVFRLTHDRYYRTSEGAGKGGIRTERGAKIPKTREELFQYDIVILGRLIDSLADDDFADLLRDFLTERGGIIVFARGKPNLDGLPELKKLEPVAWSRDVVSDFLIEVTPEGRANPCFEIAPGEPPETVMRKLPRMLAAERPERTKTMAVVLARAEGPGQVGGEESPVVVFQRYGKGRTMTVCAAGLWRWAFLPDRLKEYDTAYARFWGQMLRWLVAGSDVLPGSDVTFRTSATCYSLGDEVKIYLRLRYPERVVEKPAVELTDPSGRKVKMMLYPDEDLTGLYTGSYFPRRPGEYTAVLTNMDRAQSEQQEAKFTIYADTLEDLNVAADPQAMKRLAELSGGEAIESGHVGRLPRLLEAARNQVEEKIEYVDVWDRAAVFWLIAGVFAAEWFLRRKNGLY